MNRCAMIYSFSEHRVNVWRTDGSVLIGTLSFLGARSPDCPPQHCTRLSDRGDVAVYAENKSGTEWCPPFAHGNTRALPHYPSPLLADRPVCSSIMFPTFTSFPRVCPRLLVLDCLRPPPVTGIQRRHAGPSGATPPGAWTRPPDLRAPRVWPPMPSRIGTRPSPLTSFHWLHGRRASARRPRLSPPNRSSSRAVARAADDPDATAKIGY
jgi:hypothetical protein